MGYSYLALGFCVYFPHGGAGSRLRCVRAGNEGYRWAIATNQLRINRRLEVNGRMQQWDCLGETPRDFMQNVAALSIRGAKLLPPLYLASISICYNYQNILGLPKDLLETQLKSMAYSFSISTPPLMSS